MISNAKFAVERQFLSVVDSFSAVLLNLPSKATLSQIQQAHAHLLKTGLSNYTNLATKLLSHYLERQFSDAFVLFKSIHEPDTFCFSTFISACSKSDRFDQALRQFARMISKGFLPDNFIFPSVLKACGGLSSLTIGQQVHALASVTGLESDSFIQSSLVLMYVKCDQLNYAHKVFEGNSLRNVVSWSTMVSSYARKGEAEKAKEMFANMWSSGVEPNIITWNGLISGFNHSGCFQDSINILHQMHSKGFKPDGTSISSVLPSIGAMKGLITGELIHGYSLKCGFSLDACVASALVDMYGKCGLAHKMLQFFNEMEEKDLGSCNALVSGLSRNGLVNDAMRMFQKFRNERIELNVVSWTSIVACCAQNGKDIEALEIFRDMQSAGIKPNSVTIPCLLPACSNIVAVKQGKTIHGFSIRNGIIDDVYVSSAVIDMYAKCGRIDCARQVFDRMPVRNLVSWNAIVGGYAMHGKAEDSIQMFHLMQKYGQKPDFISFTCILSACSRAGYTEEGRQFFKKMIFEYDITATMEHYACMVNLLGRAGKLEEAYDMIKRMPSEPDSCVWGALLNSCRIHGDVGLGETAAYKLFKLEPKNAGNYVLLSNIYASKGMWSEVDRIRDWMNDIGLKKNPGCSWIEIKNKMYTLLAGDKSYPQMPQIIERLSRLGTEMKKSGCFPSTGFVLQDVEEQDKEHILCGHSEKLAIGFALLNTPDGTPIRVIKNLRTCGDCHSVIKFISRFEGREIFVRDTNRFHHFKGGECSCRDYW